MINKHYSDLIENYITNRMSDLEKVEFEHLLSTNSDLKTEYLFQNQLVHSIQEHRRQELKARLSEIQITSPVPFGWTAALSGIAVATLIGLGIYLWSIDDQGAFIDLTEENITTFAGETIAEKPSIYLEEAIVKEQQIQIPIEETVASIENLIAANSDEIEENSVPQIASVENKLPKTGLSSSEEVINSEVNEPLPPTALINHSESISGVDVQLLENKKYDFHYQFYDNTLFVYGQFNKEPYEIIEIKSKKGRDLYLFWDEQYYFIENTQVIQSFAQVIDDELKAELDTLRSTRR